jgi:hypothetical protein
MGIDPSKQSVNRRESGREREGRKKMLCAENVFRGNEQRKKKRKRERRIK